MLLFYNFNSFQKYNDVSIKKYTLSDDNHFTKTLIDFPEEYFSKDNFGWQNIVVKHNRPEVLCPKGIVQYNTTTNRFELDNIDNKFKLDSAGTSGLREMVTYDNHSDQYLKLTIYNNKTSVSYQS